jgi:hypothetical protein
MAFLETTATLESVSAVPSLAGGGLAVNRFAVGDQDSFLFLALGRGMGRSGYVLCYGRYDLEKQSAKPTVY